jgi:hypothetical protein
VLRCRWRSRRFLAVAGATAVLLSGSSAAAQRSHTIPRAATTAEVIGANILIGGVVAAARALFTDADPFRAFTIGAIGGGVHLAGKNLAVEPGVRNAWAGLVLASTGASIVANAGAGVHPLKEVSIPLASTRLRVTPFADRKVTLAVNLVESAFIVRYAVRDRLSVDWNRSLRSGVLVYFAQQKRIFVGEREVGGFALAPTTVISTFVEDTARIIRHEVVHVHQQWFLQGAVGRPIEDAIRARLGIARHVPKWIEIGVVGPTIIGVYDWATREKGVGSVLEAEAERLDRR